MTDEECKELEELEKELKRIKNRIKELNPYASLKEMSNKEFGEGWSEKYILSKCPFFKADNGLGHDFIYQLGTVEVKSSRLPCKQITYNQCHPNECDFFLFINYDTTNGIEEVYFVPSDDILNETIFSKSKQHSRDGSCYTI